MSDNPKQLGAPGSEPGEEPDAQPLEARDPDEILSPAPFRDPADFEPIPPPKASFGDILELAGHILFVLVVTVGIPLAATWVVYRLYRWLPFETIALVVVALASVWAYRDRLGEALRRILFGKERKDAR